MRHLIILPGNSPRNRAWGEACAAHFSKWFDSVWVQEYLHWQSGERWINLAREEERLHVHVAPVAADTAVYMFAKSIGSILAVNAIAHGSVTPTGSAFFGMPLDHAVPEVWQGSVAPLTTLTAPTLVFHNDADPTTQYEYTRDTLAVGAPQVTFVTTEGATHDYLDFASYEPAILPTIWKH